MNGTYDLALLIASWCVAASASYAALSLGGRIAQSNGERERFWLCGSTLVLGTALWALNIVGMTAFKMPMTVSFDLALTALSWLSALAVAGLVLYVISRRRLSAASLAGGAVLIGAGLSLTHYSGLWALRLTPGIDYDLVLVGVSAAIAAMTSAVLLFTCFSVRQMPGAMPARIAASLVIGAMLCATHYTSLSAVRFAPHALCAAGNLLGGAWMGLPLALINIGLLGAVLLLSKMDALATQERSRAEMQRNEVERVRRMAYYDAVTGLPNRSLFNETLLRQLISVNGQPPRPFGVVYVELRGYRALIEKLGQDRVNLLLRTVAEQLSQNLREGDLLARLSHDGFVCLLRQHGDRSLETAAAQVSARFNLPVQCESQTFKLVWGIGCSRFPDNGNSTQALIRSAMKLQQEVGGEARPARREAVSAFGAA